MRSERETVGGIPSAVRGCEYKDATDPGNLEFDWLDVQLGLFRDRKMQVSSQPRLESCYLDGFSRFG